MNDNIYKIFKLIIKIRYKIFVSIILSIFVFFLYIYFLPHKYTASFSVTIPVIDNIKIYSNDSFLLYLKSESFINSVLIELNEENTNNNISLIVKSALKTGSFDRTQSKISFNVNGKNDVDLINLSNSLASIILTKFNKSYEEHLKINNDSLSYLISLRNKLRASNYSTQSSLSIPLMGIYELENYINSLLIIKANSLPAFIYTKPFINYQLLYTVMFLKFICITFIFIFITVLLYYKNLFNYYFKYFFDKING